MPNELFYAEVRGFFWGEGCVDIQKIHRSSNQYPVYRPRVRISLRSDDAEILEVIYAEFGGSLSYQTNQAKNPSVSWQLTTHTDLLTFCNFMLEECHLPSKKIPQLELLKEAVELRLSGPGSHIPESDRERLEEIHQELRRIKKFDW